jgi:hypothetical protein
MSGDVKRKRLLSSVGLSRNTYLRTQVPALGSDRAGLGYVYFLHMRKAGGTSLRKYLDSLIKQDQRMIAYVSEYDYAIASVGMTDHVWFPLRYVTEGDTFNVSCLRDQGELLTVTNFRHPMDRLLSAYW